MAEQKQEALPEGKADSQKSRGLLSLDVDHTLIRGHSHELISRLINFYKGEITPEKIEIFIHQMIHNNFILESEEAALRTWMENYALVHENKTFNKNSTDIINSIFRILPPTSGDAKRWKALITNWVQAGGKISLNTFSDYKDNLPYYLKHVIGLEDHIVEQIYIEPKCTSSQGNKNLSITASIKYFEKDLSRDALMVFSDDDVKILRAIDSPREKKSFPFKDRITTVQANDEGAHLDSLEKQLIALQEKAKLPISEDQIKPELERSSPKSEDERNPITPRRRLEFRFDEEEEVAKTPQLSRLQKLHEKLSSQPGGSISRKRKESPTSELIYEAPVSFFGRRSPSPSAVNLASGQPIAQPLPQQPSENPVSSSRQESPPPFTLSLSLNPEGEG